LLAGAGRCAFGGAAQIIGEGQHIAGE
jgi:hypothetical protein